MIEAKLTEGDQENGAVNFLVFLPNTDRSLKAEVGASPISGLRESPLLGADTSVPPW